jgi:hypothetical protein
MAKKRHNIADLPYDPYIGMMFCLAGFVSPHEFHKKKGGANGSAFLTSTS